ncbi:CapA family protein [Halalkalibacter urbisdiaboli]|uniref:CapA family protein n=1 Tax=Halalkalibacter urbisdiaboli TaxID=1960589 RepID=UPI000B444DA0|nr:CapA family protein [Halalkalibacter urbisdiaboli]
MVKRFCLLFIVPVVIFVCTGCAQNEEDISRERQPLQNQDDIAPQKEIEPEPPITFSFAGDTMAAGNVAPILEEKGYQFPWEQARPYLEESDIAMVNLETAVSLRGEPTNKTYAFRSHPDLIKGMKWAGVNMVTVANNHSLDFGTESFEDTLNTLTEHDITYVGGGFNEEEAYQSKQMTIRGKTVSFLGFSRVLPSVSWYARKEQPGLASGYQDERVYELATQAVENSDITVVYMHWGKELADTPETADREMARQLIDLGVDMVIGSHPHVLQGLEYYKGKLIAYSLGNFIFTNSHQELARQSVVLQVAINEDGKQTAKVYPMKIDMGAVWTADNQESENIMKRLSSLSKGGEWTEEGEYLPN